MKYEWEDEVQSELHSWETEMQRNAHVVLGFLVYDPDSVEGAIILNPNADIPTSIAGADVMQDILGDAQSLYNDAFETWQAELTRGPRKAKGEK